MPKPTTVTYDLFAMTAYALEHHGERVSVRTIRDEIGGSNSKLAEFLRQWRAEKRLASSAATDEDMSPVFKQALLAEFGRIAQKERTTLENQLADEKISTQETLDLLSETEKRAVNLEETITTLKQEHEAATTAYDKKTSALEARLADAKARETELTKKLESTLAKLHQSEIETAVLKSRCEALEKQCSTKEKKA